MRGSARALYPLAWRIATLVAVASTGAAAASVPDRASVADDSALQAIPEMSRCPVPLPILLERRLARRTGLGAGDGVAVRAGPEQASCPARVSGVFEPGPDPARLARERPRVLLHLPDLARLTGRESTVDRFSIRLNDRADPHDVRADLASLLPGARVLRTEEVAARSSTTFQVVRRFHRAIAGITLVAGAVFLACIMILKVEERRPQVAALRLAGVSRRTLLGWVVGEAALIAVLGGGLGIGIGGLASLAINKYYRAAFDTTLTFSLVTSETILLTLGLALVLGLAAGGAAAARLFSLDPLEEVGR